MPLFQHNNMTFKLLYWTHSYFGPNWIGVGGDAFEACEYSNCVGTRDKEEYNKSDAVFFHFGKFMKRIKLPSYRIRNQKWIMHVRESPANQPSYARYNHMFNGTWTYDRRSDIYQKGNQHWLRRYFKRRNTLV